jgi:cupin fold WbuC family metalloprotein
MVRLDDAALDTLLREAKASPRRRSHLLLHHGHDDQVQRLAIALRRGTYVRPHVHSAQWEMLVLLRGAADLLFFDASGKLSERHALAPDRTSVIQIPPGQVHGAVALVDDSVVVEIKPGPYRVNEFMDWAPEEGAADAAALVDWMSTAAIGASWADRSRPT